MRLQLRQDPVDLSLPGVRVTGKQEARNVQCTKCRSRATGLHRMLGSWPVREFDELDEAAQLEFYKTCGT